MAFEISLSITPLFEPEKIIKTLSDKVQIRVQGSLVESSDRVVDYIRGYINQNSRRHTGYLAESIEATLVGAGAHELFIGIGEIARLPKYWQIINYGGFTTAAEGGWTIVGGFDGDTPPDPNLKGTGVGGGKWSSDGMWAMKPRTEIWGKHYIEADKAYMEIEIKKAVSEAIKYALASGMKV